MGWDDIILPLSIAWLTGCVTSDQYKVAVQGMQPRRSLRLLTEQPRRLRAGARPAVLVPVAKMVTIGRCQAGCQ